MLDPAIGVVIVLTTLTAIAREWIGGSVFDAAAILLLPAFLVLTTPGARRSRQAFVALGLGLLVFAVATRQDWPEILAAASSQGAFIAGFFAALATLRIPASLSPAIERCGLYLASQPPGKRYLALNFGGHVFALILNYGAITLLGSLTEAIANKEQNAEVRDIRNQRMLLAIQRGFCASLTWSPLAFAMAISTALIPGASFTGAAAFGLVNAVILTIVGYLLDRLIKPKISGPRPRPNPIGSFADLKPLAILLLLIFGIVGFLEVLTGLRIIAIVMLIVPIIALGWAVIQIGPKRAVTERARGFIVRDAPSYRSELLLLVMAGFIGSLGGTLAEPLLAASGFDLSAVPGVFLVAALVWIVPVLGQLGMNPILSVSLLAPLIPAASTLGVSPNAIVAGITAGWALTGATSPFTATTMLVGRLGHTSAVRVGVIWNGIFWLVGGLALSISVALMAAYT